MYRYRIQFSKFFALKNRGVWYFYNHNHLMLSNKEVSKLFKTLCGLMELHGENDFKTKSYANAAFQIGRIHEPVMEMDPAILEKQPGVGKSVFAKIMELRETGTMQALEEYMQITPPGLIEILNIKGLGGKKVGSIWRDLGIESVGELLYACYENRLAKLKGFGEKTQESVIQSIEYYQNNLGKFHYAAVADEADEIEAYLKTTLGEKVSLCGAIRRKCNIVDQLELICSDQYAIHDQLEKLTFIRETSALPSFISGVTESGLRIGIHVVPEEEYYYALFLKTGSEQHTQHIVAKLNGKKHFNSEKDIYATAGMEYILPELREDDMELLPGGYHELINEADIRGVVHNHSTWSDGKNTVAQMAEACKKSGFEYFVISDHSKTAVYAGGLSEESIAAQQKEIDALNAADPAFKIYKSIECDILNDGTLDYADDILRSFDLVITSVHQNLKMDEEKATARLLRAIENPYTTILGHMTGRLLLSRPGYPVDHKKIIEACAANQVVIEINANPYRLDIDHTHIPYALKKGVMISINPDAHSVDGINDIRWGVISARKGGLTRNMTWNALSRTEVDNWLLERKKKKGIL